MYEPNVTELLARLRPDDMVLDVGGWACPFNRAQWILDAQPFATRGFYRTFGGRPYQGGDVEWFTQDTWVQRDICDKEPFPFPDKFFDFVVCSHTLEDLRDPLWVCSEMIRIGKAGYIEIPSRIAESIRGLERPKMVGLSHHRWLIDIEGSHVKFLQKFGLIHSHWRFSLPATMARKVGQEKMVQWLWWIGQFEFEEITIHGLPGVEAALESWVRKVHPYPSLMITADALVRKSLQTFRRLPGALMRWLRPRP